MQLCQFAAQEKLFFFDIQNTFFLGLVKNISEELRVQYMMTRGMLK